MTLDIRSLFTGSAFDPCRMMKGGRCRRPGECRGAGRRRSAGVVECDLPRPAGTRPQTGGLRSRMIGYMLAHEQFTVPDLIEISTTADRAGCSSSVNAFGPTAGAIPASRGRRTPPRSWARGRAASGACWRCPRARCAHTTGTS